MPEDNNMGISSNVGGEPIASAMMAMYCMGVVDRRICPSLNNVPGSLRTTAPALVARDGKKTTKNN